MKHQSEVKENSSSKKKLKPCTKKYTERNLYGVSAVKIRSTETPNGAHKKIRNNTHNNDMK